jgi:O-antigen/teichoic acid export membrane protein
LLARNTLLNLLGQGLPMAVAIVTIPIVIGGLGVERFGVLTIAWMAIGYFSLFDLGLGRALTQILASRLGTADHGTVPRLAWTALAATTLFGLLGAILLALLGPWLVTGVLQIPERLQPESRTAFFLLAASIPWVVSTAALRGVLEAVQRFDLVNAVRVPLGLATYLVPVAVLPFSQSLVPIVAALLVSRLAGWVAHLLLCFRALPELRNRIDFSVAEIRPLLRFGSWMTVSNLVSPLMVYLDRFLIGAVLSMAAVAYYVTPYEVITKLWVVPVSLMSVLLPAFAASYATDRERAASLFDLGVRSVFLVMLPPAVIAILFAPEALTIWLGAEFAAESFRVLQWLAIGVFVNSIGQVGFTFLQGMGRPDLTAKLHLLEFPLYAGFLWWLLPRYGIEGAAIAWTARVLLDAALLQLLSRSRIPLADGLVASRAGMMVLAVLLPAGMVVGATGSVEAKIGLLAVSALAIILIGWFAVLRPEERLRFRTMTRRRTPPAVGKTL